MAMNGAAWMVIKAMTRTGRPGPAAGTRPAASASLEMAKKPATNRRTASAIETASRRRVRPV